MGKFRVSGLNIENLKVVKETEKQIVYISSSGHEYREAKNSQYAQWFDTYYDAKLYLVDKWTKRVKSAENSLSFAKDALNKITNYKQ